MEFSPLKSIVPVKTDDSLWEDSIPVSRTEPVIVPPFQTDSTPATIIPIISNEDKSDKAPPVLVKPPKQTRNSAPLIQRKTLSTNEKNVKLRSKRKFNRENPTINANPTPAKAVSKYMIAKLNKDKLKKMIANY